MRSLLVLLLAGLFLVPTAVASIPPTNPTNHFFHQFAWEEFYGIDAQTTGQSSEICIKARLFCVGPIQGGLPILHGKYGVRANYSDFWMNHTVHPTRTGWAGPYTVPVPFVGIVPVCADTCNALRPVNGTSTFYGQITIHAGSATVGVPVNGSYNLSKMMDPVVRPQQGPS